MGPTSAKPNGFGVWKIVALLTSVLAGVLGASFTYWAGRVEGMERAMEAFVASAEKEHRNIDVRITKQEERYIAIISKLEDIEIVLQMRAKRSRPGG